MSSVHTVGALQYLLETGHLCELKSIYCFSFGALIATVFAVHGNFKQILVEIQKPQIAQSCKLMQSLIGIAVVCPYLRKYINMLLVTVIQALLPEGVMTLRHLQDASGKRIHVLVCKQGAFVNRVFDSLRHPHVMLKDLLVATCAIPFIFEPVMIDGEPYVDGIVFSGFPHITIKQPRNCLLIGCQTARLHYGINIFQQLWNQLLSVQTQRMLDRTKTIMHFRMPSLSSVSLYVSDAQLEQMYLLGALIASCEVTIHMKDLLPSARMACCQVSAACIALEQPCTEEQERYAERAKMCNIRVFQSKQSTGFATCACGSSALKWM